MVKEGTLRAHMAIGFEENTGTYLSDKYVGGSLPCVGSPEISATCHTIANWLKFLCFFFHFVFFFLAPSYLLDFFLTENI